MTEAFKPKTFNEATVKGLLKKRAFRALCLSNETPERKLLTAVVYQAIDDYDRPHGDQRSAIDLLNSWWPNWRADKLAIEQHLSSIEAAQ